MAAASAGAFISLLSVNGRGTCPRDGPPSFQLQVYRSFFLATTLLTEIW